METVAEILDGPRPVKAGATPFVPQTLPDAPKLPAPGIYFGMPDEDYHALPALSASGIKCLLASPMLYWAKHTWLSEVARKRELRERSNPKSQLVRTIGKAYHCRILEGPAEYTRRFACELAPDDVADALETTDQIKAAIAAHGAKPVAKVPDVTPGGDPYERAAKKDDWTAQLLAIDPAARILSVLQADYAREHDGKHFIPPDAWEQIEISAAMIERDPEARRAFMGGYPEVTLLWHCAETGAPMKARVDYLQLHAAVDLKSIGNEDRSLEQAIPVAIARYKYNLQPSVYLEGIQAVRALVRAGGHATVCSKEFPREAPEWVRKWAAVTDEPKWLWIFQQKGPAPVTRGLFYPTLGTTRMITDDMVKRAKRRFIECSQAFGTDPWVDVAPIYDLSDEDLPPYATDI